MGRRTKLPTSNSNRKVTSADIPIMVVKSFEPERLKRLQQRVNSAPNDDTARNIIAQAASALRGRQPHTLRV